MPIRVTFWNEFRHEKQKDVVKALFPNGLHAHVKSWLQSDDISITLASLDEPEQGLPDELLNSTDVLMWWGHAYHAEVSDELAEKIAQRVFSGMGFLPLHSAHHSKPFKKILGCTGHLRWGRNQKAVVWNLAPDHPIAAGIPMSFQLFEELYSEPFYIPKPDEVVFATWFEDGNIFRGGITYKRGLGRIFYFHPGHESLESFKNEHVQRIIRNAVYWCAPNVDGSFYNGKTFHQLEPIVK